MKMIIAGSRDWTDYSGLSRAIAVALERTAWTPTAILSGGARGVDALGERYARARELGLEVFPADWTAHGRAAGPLRNRAMAARADCALILAYAHSRGSADCLHACLAEGVPVVWCDATTGRMHLRRRPQHSA